MGLYDTIKEKMIASYFGNSVLNALRISGVIHLVHLIKGAGGGGAKLNPEYRNFIQAHKKELDIVESYLSDKRSKEVFKGIISYRVTGEYRYLKNIMDQPQYFLKEIIRPTEHEVFVDGGGYIGDTVMGFIKFTKKKYDEVYMWEPDKSNIDKAKKILKKWDNINIIPYAMFSRKDILYFDAGLGDVSSLKERGKSRVPCESLDNLLGNKRITFIKMDIEGAELEALKGAERIIREQKPKLAICIYHKPEDIYEIPMFIKSFVPEYKIYIRHHHDARSETVLYAVL